jgi:branched-chain amino acid transport system substrate-binding protein
MTSSRRGRVLGAVIALAMFAGACSDDDEGGGAAATNPSTSAAAVTSAPGSTSAVTTPETYPTPTGEPIRFGTTIWTLDRIGFNVKLPGIEAAVRYVNSHGGINGRPVEWVYCPAADAPAGEACAHTMVEQGVVATVSDGNMVAENVALDVLRNANIPVIDPFLGFTQGMNDSNVYLMCPPTVIDYSGVVAYMHLLGKSKLFILLGASTQGDVVKSVVDNAVAHYGIEVVGQVDVPITAADYLSQMQAAADAGADANLAVIAPFQTAEVLQAASQLDTQAKFGLQEGQFNQGQYREFGQTGGPLDGSLLVSCVPPFSAADQFPAVQAALDEVNAYYEESGDELASPDRLTTLGLQSYFDVLAFAEAARAVPDGTEISGVSIKQVLDTTTGIDIGLARPWVPSSPGPAGLSRVSNTYEYLCMVKDGVSVLYQNEPIDAAEGLG